MNLGSAGLTACATALSEQYSASVLLRAAGAGKAAGGVVESVLRELSVSERQNQKANGKGQK